MHKQGKEDEGVARKCSVIGLLLPTRETELSEKTGLQRYDELFSTLAYDSIVYARQATYTVDIELLKVWMSFCAKSHTRCKNILQDCEAKPSLRLIDVLEQRLVEATFDKDYVALSYVWGKGRNEVLLRGTIEQFQQAGSLAIESMPRIVGDVMELVAALGERYLWVDTACIIQDDPSDKQRQLPNMSSIYSHAKLTIIAAVNNAKDPLPRWKQCNHNIGPTPELLNGVPYTTAQPHLTRTLSQTTWAQRGWTFQEGQLARRALVFTQELVYWTCREESWCEDQYTEFCDVRHEPSAETSLFATRVEINACGRRGGILFNELCPMGLYAQKAESYSLRTFSNFSDVVWAFVGILQDMKKEFPKGYIWALPYDRLDSALLWQTCCTSGRCAEHQYGPGLDTRLPIPSWCWIAKGHRAWFEDGFCKTKSRVTWHKPIAYSPEFDSNVRAEDEFAECMEAPMFADSKTLQTEAFICDFAFLHFTAQTTMLLTELESTPSNLRTFAAYKRTGRAQHHGLSRVSAHVYSPSKRKIGQIQVPVSVFRNATSRVCEFVLLSEYTGEIHTPTEEIEVQEGVTMVHEKVDDDVDVKDTTTGHAEDSKRHHHHYNEAEHLARHNRVVRTQSVGEHEEGCAHVPALNVMLIEWVKARKHENFAIRVGVGRIEPSAWDEVIAVEKTIILG